MLAVLDLIGIFVFALSGASLAVRKRLDVVGAVSLAIATGLAGGMLRDVFLGSTPPVALSNQWYLSVPLAAAALTIVVPRFPELVRRPVIIFDAAGLALFAVVGASKAVDAGLGILAATFIGALSATGGGILRDVLVREVPAIFTPASGLYVIPAALGSLAIAGAAEAEVEFEAVGLPVALLIFIVRLASVQYGWSTPRLGTDPGSAEAD